MKPEGKICTMLTVGTFHYVLLDETGSIWACGRNEYGQLGLSEKRVYSDLTKIESLPPIVSAFANFSSSYFIDINGSVWWCGDGVFEVQQLNNLPPIQHIFLFNKFVFFLDIQGSLWVTKNWETNSAEKCHTEVMPLDINVRVKTVVINSTFRLILDENGILWELIGTSEVRMMENLPKIKTTSIISGHTVLLDVDGNVWSAGENSSGQCGHGTRGYLVEKFTKIQNLPKIQEVKTGVYHTVLLDVEGCIWGFGYNATGELGTGTKKKQLIPRKRENLPRMCSILCSGYATLAIDEEGTIWGTGCLIVCSGKVIFEPVPNFAGITMGRKMRNTKSSRNSNAAC